MAPRAPAFLLRHSCGFDAPSLSAAPCAAVRRRRIGPTAPSPPRRRPAFILARYLLVAHPDRPQALAGLARLELGVGVALAGAGFRSEAGPASDGDDWLVIATHHEVAERDREVATQEAMREIAIAVGGTYNGYAVRAK